MAVATMCQRHARLPRSCEICIAGCPVDALEPRAHTLFTADRCLKCGACMSMCPMSALGATRQNVQETTRRLLEATLKTRELVLTCQRTRYLVRAEAAAAGGAAGAAGTPGGGAAAGGVAGADGADGETETDAAATNNTPTSDAQLLDSAEADGILHSVACLAMLSAPIWFALLNEAEITPLERIGVLLPAGQCAKCPVNAKNNIEALIDAAISTAENWTQTSVELYGSAAELPRKADASLLEFLRAPTEPDRREALTGVFRGLKNAWDELGRRDNQALLAVQRERSRRDAYKRTQLGKSLEEQRRSSTLPRSIIVPSRYQLVDALGRNPAHAGDVRLNVSTTDAARCTLCGNCVDACPLHARRIVEPDDKGDEGDAGAGAAAAADAGASAGAAADGAGAEAGGNDAGTTGSIDGPRVVCEEIYCVGCDACREVCETGACQLTTISAERFLL
jgi:ferredoxin